MKGPGVPEELVDNLFDRFSQGDAGMNGQAGLGIVFLQNYR